MNREAFCVKHPVGRPEYANDKGNAPPVTRTERLKGDETFTELGAMLNERMEGAVGSTVTLVVAFAACPAESVSTTFTRNCPVEEGVQVRDETFALLHPGGRAE